MPLWSVAGFFPGCNTSSGQGQLRHCDKPAKYITLSDKRGNRSSPSQVHKSALPMTVNFRPLPALIALAILVAVFAAISRQHAKERVRLWLIGWAFVLLRCVVQFVHPAGS